MIWAIVAYAVIGIVVCVVCMATGCGIVSDMYTGHYPESAGAGFAAISCILLFGILAGIIWPIATVTVFIAMIVAGLKDNGGKP